MISIRSRLNNPQDTKSVHSEAADVPQATDQRSAPRFTLLIRSAKLVSPDAEYL
jgi:hypothetical protein